MEGLGGAKSGSRVGVSMEGSGVVILTIAI